VPTIQREDVRFENGGHGANSAFAHPTGYRNDCSERSPHEPMGRAKARPISDMRVGWIRISPGAN
jgi:hypothetical protein